jgi:hypothetical protein
LVYTFPCKHTDCLLEVTWDDEEIPLSHALVGKVEGSGQTRRVFLTCADGHTYSYEAPAGE